MEFPVIKGVAYAQAHTPDLVRYGSKPERELRRDPALIERIASHLRDFKEAVAYPPNQVFIGGIPPEELWAMPRPWWRIAGTGVQRAGRFGEIWPQDEFYGLLKLVDEFGLVLLDRSFVERIRTRVRENSVIKPSDLDRLGEGQPSARIEAGMARQSALPLYDDGRVVGCVLPAHEEDPCLSPSIMLENLACKATGVLAIRLLLHASSGSGIEPSAIDYVVNSGEEAVGDRYQRGAGNLAKAMAELCECQNSTGSDLKAFCCGPIHAVVMAAALVQSGIFRNVIVVGGGALTKLGMKFRGHLSAEMPILEDVLASFAILIGTHDGRNPSIRTDAIGKHEVRCGGSAQGVSQALVADPLEKLKLKINEIDKYAVELHNPEVTEPAGSGNVPAHNYRTIASLGAMRGQWPRDKIGEFERIHGLPGFSPTQGHVASAVPYLGHAIHGMLSGEIKKAMFIGKGSLFLGKMTNLSDGMSFLLEAE
jgi:hypothetical protein